MKVKTFEAYKYLGKGLNVSRKDFIDEFWPMFDGLYLLGYEITGTAFDGNNEIITLFLDKKAASGNYLNEGYAIQLDISNMGVEIGKLEWSDPDEGDFEFKAIANLDTPEIKAVKDYKSNIQKFNL